MFKKKYMIIIVLIILAATISTVNASEMNQTIKDNDILEDSQDISQISIQKDESIQTTIDIQKEDVLQTNTNTIEEKLTVENSKNIISESSPKHVNLAVSDKSVTYSKLHHIKVKVTDDDGNPLKNVYILFKIYKGNKLVDTQDEWGTGKDGCVYYCTENLKAGNYKVTYDIIDKNKYTASPATSKLTVKKIKLTAKIKRGLGEVDIILKKNKKPANKIKLLVKIYTGKKYQKLYLKTGYNKKISKYKGFCAFLTNDLKVGKHKVVITSSNKNYQFKKTTSIKVTKAMKKVEPLLVIASGGKVYIYAGF